MAAMVWACRAFSASRWRARSVTRSRWVWKSRSIPGPYGSAPAPKRSVTEAEMAGAGQRVGEGRQLPLHRRNAVPRLAQPPFGLAHGIFRAQPGEVESGAPFLHLLFRNGFPVERGGGGIEALGRVGAGLPGDRPGRAGPVRPDAGPAYRMPCVSSAPLAAWRSLAVASRPASVLAASCRRAISALARFAASDKSRSAASSRARALPPASSSCWAGAEGWASLTANRAGAGYAACLMPQTSCHAWKARVRSAR